MTCYLWYFIKTQLYKKNNKECIYSIKPIFHEYVPILIQGAYGEYSSIINGEYIPLCCPFTETNYYKKSDSSNITIEYNYALHTWKIRKDGCQTIAQIKSFVEFIPINKINNAYWDIIRTDPETPLEPQFGIIIYAQ